MAPQKASRKSIPKQSAKASTKRGSTTKAPRKSRVSLPTSASESQKTLTQIHFIPRVGELEQVDLEYLEPIQAVSEGEGAVGPPQTTPASRSTAKPRSTSAAKSTQKRKRKLETDPSNKTLTQIGYVARYQVKIIEDEEEDMECLRHVDLGDAEPGNGPHSEDTLTEESGTEHIRIDTDSALVSNKGKGQSSTDGADHQKANGKRKRAGKGSRLAKEIANHLRSPEKPMSNRNGKRKASLQDANGDAESDYADDESPKRRKRQRVSPDSQAPVASRLRPRRAHVSYVGNLFTKDVNRPGRKNDASNKPRKNTRSMSVVSKPETPVKSRFAEIPSSQSPDSTPLSIRSRPPTRLGETSPLRSPLTDLSAYSRMANSAKFLRSNEKGNTNQTPSGSPNGCFRSIQQIGGAVAPTNVTKENIPADQHSPRSTSSSHPESSLPDLATIFASTLAQSTPRESLIPPEIAVDDPNQDINNEFEMGIETQAAFDHLGHSSATHSDDGFDLSQEVSRVPPLETTNTPEQPSNVQDPAARLQSDSPPWISNNLFSSARCQESSKAPRQSQISTQGVPQSSDPPAARSQFKDLTQIWGSSDSTFYQRQQPKASPCSRTPDPNASTSPKTHQPKDLTHIWDSTDSTSSQHIKSKSISRTKMIFPPKPQPPRQLVSSPPELQAQAKDLTQIWDSDSSEEVLTASQLLPASMLESLRKPPALTQECFSDEDWI